ncbi:MAG: peptidoglycan glycosyltransferase, partial [Eubacterium sp.]|nr:peptidoglycan glycosyltransferase [Eubacterium sp.]
MARNYRQEAYSRRRRRRIRAREKRFTRKMRVAIFIFFALSIVMFAGLGVKIYYINHEKGDSYRKEALSQQAYTNKGLNYQRGGIVDRNDTTLAVSVRKYNVILEPRTLLAEEEKRPTSIREISDFFGVSQESLNKIVDENPKSLYEHVESLREIDSKKIKKFKKIMRNNKDIVGIWFEETYTREYPLDNVGCNIIGFMGADDHGTYGIEESYNNELCGTTGREFGYFDANMNLQRTVKEAKDGNSVVLTIDANVQQTVEKMIKNFQEKGVGAETVGVMLMNPKNGEVLAMASNNTFDLNNPRTLKTMYTDQEIAAMSEEEQKTNLMTMWSNFCIGSAYEPGSTYKPFTIAAALDEGLINGNSTFVCNGVVNVADRQIHCSNRSGHGVLDLRHALMKSCNAALMDIGLKLGRNNFIKYNKLYGFGQRTGI